uniref:Uncharacterized protein n=1 Tax=Anguilla anguilla TaxID=7936 RepID=A0A0E9RW63_ANGAN
MEELVVNSMKTTIPSRKIVPSRFHAIQLAFCNFLHYII